MTAKEYYKSTRMVDTRNWTLEMTLAFAEEYYESRMKVLPQADVIKSVCDKCGGDGIYREAFCKFDVKCDCGA